MHELTVEIVNRFSSRMEVERPFIVALDGLSGAGKTTLVKQLKEELRANGCKVTVFHIDDHIVERKKRYETGHEEWYEFYAIQWDVEELRVKLFEGLRRNEPVLKMSYYNKATDQLSNKEIAIEADSIVLIEGIFLQRQAWRMYYDFVVYLNCPREMRLGRVLNRDTYIGDEREVLDKYNRRYWPGEDYYLKTENPLEQADRIWRVN